MPTVGRSVVAPWSTSRAHAWTGAGTPHATWRRRRFIRQDDATLTSPLLHEPVVLEPVRFSLLSGLQVAHVKPVLLSFLRGHELAAVDAVLILLLQPIPVLSAIAVLCV